MTAPSAQVATLNREELDGLATLHGLDVASDIDALTDALRGPIARYQEWELRSDGARIDLVTLSESYEDVAPFLGVLERRGVGEDALADLKRLSRFGAGSTLGMKLPVAGAMAGGELYVRRALPLPQIRPLLLDLDVTPESLDRVMRIGEVFGKEHLHILALDATRPRELSFFFTHYLVSGHEAEDLTLLEDVLDLLGLGPSAREPLARTHQSLGSERPATLFVSGKLVDGQLAPAVKLDYASPRLGVLSDMMSVVLDEAAADMAIRWGSVMGTTRASYGGVVLDPEGVRGVRAYFTRWSTAYQSG